MALSRLRSHPKQTTYADSIWVTCDDVRPDATKFDDNDDRNDDNLANLQRRVSSGCDTRDVEYRVKRIYQASLLHAGLFAIQARIDDEFIRAC